MLSRAREKSVAILRSIGYSKWGDAPTVQRVIVSMQILSEPSNIDTDCTD